MTFIKSYDNWQIYRDEHDICHAITKPVETKSFQGIRNIPYLTMTYKDYRHFTFSIYAGFNLKRTGPILLEVNEITFPLHRYRDFFAYTYNSDSDVAIFNNSIKSGKFIQVRSYNSNNETALDYYSLKGFLQTANFMQRNCNRPNYHY